MQAALGDAVLLLGQFQGVLCPRLTGRRKRRLQRLPALTGGVEVVGPLEDPPGVPFLKVQRGPPMKLAALGGPQRLEQR